jgi:hypothetical protein
MPYREELIRLYAANPVANIDGVAGFQDLRREFSEDRQFQAERHQIECAKQAIEAAVSPDVTQQEQVKSAIQLLIQTRPDQKRRNLFHELIVSGYKPAWTEERRLYFDAAWEKIKLEYDYFLSFTTRYPIAVGDNPVNNAYKHFITAVLGSDFFNGSDRKKTNLLAMAVHSVLAQASLKGFFFPHSQYDNTNTEQKLQAACDDCLVFVQLVQIIMFVPPNGGGTNYCFYEWDRAIRRFTGPDRENHILFVVATPDRSEILEGLPFVDYNAWHRHVRDKDPPYLPTAEFRDKATVLQIRSAFKDKITPKIRGAWFRLINDAP